MQVDILKNGFLIGAAFAAFSACSPGVPDSGRGVGFGTYSEYGTSGDTAGVAAIAPPPVTTGAIGASELAAAGIGTAPGSGRTGGVEATPGNAAPVIIASSGISDEQDFSAVASRETIQSDAERLAANAAAYQVAETTALLNRPGDEGPNIIAYALNAPNVKGQEWYSRFVLSANWRYDHNCASYTSADEAQRDFLARGGPERDPRGIDPDGDGFACAWDPAPFLLALQR